MQSQPEIPREEAARFLGRTALLQEVAQAQLENICRRAKILTLSRGGVIFRSADASNWVYFIYRGFVTEYVEFGGGPGILFKTRKAGDYIGETGVLSGRPYLNTAVAMDDVTLLAFSKEAFADMLALHPSVSRHIICQLIDRLTNSAKKMVNAMYLDAPARLAFTLVSLSGDMEGRRHPICVTQSELACASGAARQTVATVLGKWRALGYIATERGRLRVLNANALLDVITQCELSR